MQLLKPVVRRREMNEFGSEATVHALKKLFISNSLGLAGNYKEKHPIFQLQGTEPRSCASFDRVLFCLSVQEYDRAYRRLSALRRWF